MLLRSTLIKVVLSETSAGARELASGYSYVNPNGNDYGVTARPDSGSNPRAQRHWQRQHKRMSQVRTNPAKTITQLVDALETRTT